MFHPQGPTFGELAEQALSSTVRGYDLLAPKFDYTPFRTPDALLDCVGTWIERDGPVDTALDVCCGTGAALQMLRPHCRQRVVGVDFSRGMLQQASRLLADADCETPVHLVHADVFQMPLQPCFDIAVCFGALGHILPSQQAAFVQMVSGSLKPGGRFIFATARMPSRISPRYWVSCAFNAAMHVRNLLVQPPFIMFYLTFLLPEAAELLEDHGFEVAIHDDVFPDPFREACLVVATKRHSAPFSTSKLGEKGGG